MSKKSRNKEKVDEKRMVLCPNCGGDEFAMDFSGSIVMSDVHAVKATADETVFRHKMIALVSTHAGESVLICTDCQAEVIL